MDAGGVELDGKSFSSAIGETRHGWTIGLDSAESLTPGKVDGTLLGALPTNLRFDRVDPAEDADHLGGKG